MSAAIERLTWRQASALAYKVECQLRPGCERIQVAGSVRRKAESVGDIELVVIEKFETALFGQADPGASLLDQTLDDLMGAGKIRPGRCNGPKCKAFELVASGVGLELWIVTPETWGVALAIRTGPQAFSKSLVTERHRGGRLLDGFVQADNKVWQRYTGPNAIEVGKHDDSVCPDPICFDDERTFLDAMAGGWIEPGERR